MINPATYWRERGKMAEQLGKIGVVLGETTIYNSSPELNYLVPYAYLLVQFPGEKQELMGVAGETFAPGDRVEIVCRKLEQASATGLINYGLKVQKIKEKL